MAPAALQHLLASKTTAIAADLSPRAKPLPLGLGREKSAPSPGELLPLPEAVSALLPEGGLLRGGVVEIASCRGLGKATSLAIAACASAQAEARLRGGC